MHCLKGKQLATAAEAFPQHQMDPSPTEVNPYFLLLYQLHSDWMRTAWQL